LCFGWVDSIIRKIDDAKFARKFTPRKAVSKWSEANKRRAEKTIEEGKMTPAGLAKVEKAKNSGRWFKTPATKKELAVPSYFEEALAGNKKALAGGATSAIEPWDESGYTLAFIRDPDGVRSS
jgi:uncharacterized protein YdeI (YjbR/CyaY-like superfamily)